MLFQNLTEYETGPKFIKIMPYHWLVILYYFKLKMELEDIKTG